MAEYVPMAEFIDVEPSVDPIVENMGPFSADDTGVEHSTSIKQYTFRRPKLIYSLVVLSRPSRPGNDCTVSFSIPVPRLIVVPFKTGSG